MKYTLIAAAVSAGLTMTSVANADDPTDKIVADMNAAQHDKMGNAVRDARDYSNGEGSVVFYDEPVAIFVVGKDWDEVTRVLTGEKEIRNRLGK